ncbi:MAG: DUF4180 domain-containing protein [Oscillospiraceae bacterium]|jgi:hypothetical protein|nr:DUF4180 domain-containing protein [Oscillospiraceae bacterium]
MEIKVVKQDGREIASACGKEKCIVDTRSALDFVMTVKYETGLDRIAIEKGLIAEDFFILSTGMAGEILQKFVNYHVKAAIWGDYSRYTSKPLRDFIYESNCGKDFFFVASQKEALARLAALE